MELLPDESVRDSVVLARIDAATFRRRTSELINVYITAMRYPADLAGAASGAVGRTQPPGRLFLRHRHRSRRSHHRSGLRLSRAPGQWWYSEVRRGVRQARRESNSPTSSNSPNCTSIPTGRAMDSARPCCGHWPTTDPSDTCCYPPRRARTGPGGCTAGSVSSTCCGTIGSPAIPGRSGSSAGSCRSLPHRRSRRLRQLSLQRTVRVRLASCRPVAANRTALDRLTASANARSGEPAGRGPCRPCSTPQCETP